MTKGDLEGLSLWGRPIKPVALGFAWLMLSLTVINISNIGELGDNFLGDLIAVLAFSSFTALTAGWVFRNQHMAEYGLLAACIAYVVRTSFIMFSVGIDDAGVYLGFGAAIIAGGAYLLEATDPHTYASRTRVTDKAA